MSAGTPPSSRPPTTALAAPSASDWAAARGDKWRAHLAGMEAMLAPVDTPLVDALQLDAPARIADVGCGGGGTTLQLLRRAPPGSTVHGFDVSPGLIAVARQRLPVDASAVAFAVADVATATPQQPYERLASRFAVMFFADPPAAFANLVRWLAPGGRFAFAVWGPLAENPWMTSVRDVVAQLVDVPAAEPNAPGPFRYADGDTLTQLLAGAGFGALEVRPWRGELPVGGGLPPAQAAQFALAALSSFGELLAQSGDAARDEAHRSLTARWSAHQRDGAVVMAASVRIFTGVRPGLPCH